MGMAKVFSSDELPPGERMDYWRDRLIPDFFAIEFVHTDPNGFLGHVSGLLLGASQIARLEVSSGDYFRSAAMLKDDKEHFCLFISQSGGVHMNNADSSLTLGEGHATLVDYARLGSAFYLYQPGKTHYSQLVNLPRHALLEKAPGLDIGRHGLSHFRDAAAYRLLLSYLETLDASVSGDPALARLAENHLLDLVALMLGRPSRQTLHESAPQSLRVARFAALRQHIEANYRDTHYCAGVAASALGISERYVHDLMDEGGKSFSAAVNHLRLDEAARLLASPTHQDQRIAELALSVGFGDISYFNRLFRRKFGLTPRDFRHAARY